MVSDLEMLQDMMAKDVFSGRGKIRVLGQDVFSILRGGHGGHGLVHSEGDLFPTSRSDFSPFLAKGPSIYDGRKIFRFFDPLPPLSAFRSVL